ncbi:helix-turn-helix transcriptional regulator [Patulibacter sp.]|uniref:helix-turn-helix transcriptional regulator n=1 Tax=Patulibacter sp. TaxID=1912859 RepID=UPI002727D6C1|nr:helix-turn-helix transcriptional regulator [Patulibacter sp.]MDO9410578.1 AAA family ATPase [Patulibacter sp.]
MASRVSSARLVGRTGELAELHAALRDAAAGRPSLLLVAGESGVGKSRLLAEFEHAARTDGGPAGARVIGGDCIRLGSGEFPYAPLAAALRPLARDGDPVLAALPEATRVELGRIVPGLAPAAAPPVTGTPGPDADQARLFEALLAVVAALADDRPLVLSVEDLHWADTSTRAFLSFLSRSLCDERVLVVATYRPDELHRRHPLRPLLAEVERESRSRRIELRPLHRDELGELLGEILGGPADDALVGRLWARAEGNPLFSEELLAADLDGRGALPPTLRDALMLRIERLSETAQELLRILAVGQRLGHDLLADVSAVDAGELHPALREAVAAHVLVVDDEERYAFRHALLREVVEDDLLPGERTHLHRLLAEALERRVAQIGDDVDAISAAAHHFQEADCQPQALRAAVRAAATAERVRAHGEEADLLERALGLWPRVPDAEQRAGASHVEIVLRTSRAHESVGFLPRAEALLELAIGEIDEAEDPRLAARALGRLAQVQWAQMRAEVALQTARRGLALLEHDRGVERARLLGWWAKTRMLQGRYREAVDVARQVLMLASENQDPVAEFFARNALGISLAGTGDPDGGARELRRAIDLADLEGREVRRSSAYVNLAEVMHMAGRTRQALDVLGDARDLTRPRTHSRAWIEAAMSECALALGDWDAADAFLAPTDRWMWDNGRLNVTLRRAELALGRGDEELARALLDEAEPLADGGDEPQFHGPIGVARAALELRAGDHDAAWSAIGTALERIEFCTEDTGRIVHVACWGVRVAAHAARAAGDRREDDAPAIARAESMAERVEAAATTGGPVEDASRLVARAELACARGTGSPEDWHAVADAWRALEYPYAEACALWRAAEIEADAGHREAAATSAATALAVAERLGSRWLAAELRGLVARARLRMPAPDRPAADAPSDDPFGLTPRERQVLALVAGGATNREVGAALFMAEKTASVHVSRILAKLGVRSRTEAAAVAHRTGLAGAVATG